MNTIRRGLKRKEREDEDEYQAGLNQFQVQFCFAASFFNEIIFLLVDSY